MIDKKIEGKRKKELCEMLKAFNSKTVREEINTVIKEMRQCPDKEARDVKTLFPSEVEAVLKKFA
jgi:hypothetical protein